MEFKLSISKSIVVMLSLLLANPAIAARGEGASATTTTTMPAAPQSVTTGGPLPPSESIQAPAKKAKNSANIGILMGVGAGIFCGVKAVAACGSQNYAMCTLYVAGVAASAYVVSSMGKAKDQSASTCDAVSVNGCDAGYAGGSNPGGGTYDFHNDPTDPRNGDDFKQLQLTITDLEKKGYKINQTTGAVTFPNGKTLSAADMNNPAAMSAAGVDPAAFASAMEAAKKAGEKLAAKGTDNTSDMYGDSLGGGGGNSASANNGANSGVAAAKLGVNRDPSQVAGMSVNYNGDAIGVGPDNLFKMIHRRYDLHQQNGNFIGGQK